MTTTQVQYWANQEAKRHNLAYEKETHRHNVASETQNKYALVETKRHNVASEKLTATSIKETVRHNKVTETLTASQIAEQVRHNKASEDIGAKQAQAALTSAAAAVMQAQAAQQQANTYSKVAQSQIQLNNATTALKNAETTLTNSKSVQVIASALKGSTVGNYAGLAYTIGQIVANPNVDVATKEVLNNLLGDAKFVSNMGTNASAAQTKQAAAYVKKLKSLFTKLGLAASNWSWTINQ